MPKETDNLGLKLYDSTQDGSSKVKDLIDNLSGYTSSNMTKIDEAIKGNVDNINVLHDYIIGEDGNAVFYDKNEVDRKLGEKLSLTGGTMTGPITIKRDNATDNIIIKSAAGDAQITAVRTDTGADVRFGVGSGGDNAGVWDNKNQKWMIHSQTSTGKIYVNGTLVPKDSGTVVTTSTIGSQTAGNATKWNGTTLRQNHNTSDTWIPVFSNSAVDYVLKSEIAGLNGISASGSNYVRFTDGTQICWGSITTKTFTVKGTYMASDTGYTMSATANKNNTRPAAAFPQAFVNTSYGIALNGGYSVLTDNNTFRNSAQYNSTNLSTITSVSPALGHQTTYCTFAAGAWGYYVAVGRWK